jgi:DNA-binding response OmpR family regulator
LVESAPEGHEIAPVAVMPGMDGRALAETARALHPQLRVLYTTGYTEDEVLEYGVSRGEVELIERPFRNDALAYRVRELLDRHEPARRLIASAAAS